jgi:glycosyltransferase involved in cell wall biosynthesis
MNDMNKKILILSWCIPPAPTGAATVVGNLAQQFTRDEMIVAGEKPCNVPPVRWNNDWPELVYVQSVWPFTARGIRWWRMLQTPYVLWRCLRLVRRHKVDSIVVVFPDERFLLAGYLCARIARRRLFAYFHNTYLEDRRGWPGRLAQWLQPRVFARAEHVFVMSEGMSELYRERYPTLKQTPLVHSFNGPIPPCNVPQAVGSPMKVAICGTVNASCDDAATRLGETLASCPDTHLTIYSGTHRSHLRAIGLLREGVECMTAPLEELLPRLGEADVVVLLHGLTGPKAPEEYRTIFPTKTIEYLLSGRPILAHSPPDCFITRFLRTNECALIVDKPDVEALRDALGRLRTDFELRRRLVENALKAARQFQAATVAAELRKWIDREARS